VQDTSNVSVNEGKKKVHKAPKIKKAPKKGIPIAVDILIVVVILAAIVGAVFGINALGEYFSTRYAQREITYTCLVESVDAVLAYDANGKCVVQPGTEVFVVQDMQSAPVGEVLSVSTEDNADGTVDISVVVRTVADYNYTLGYFADQTKIAVGKTYNCRFSGLVSDAVIVELQITEKES
jgi:hypothetical protein